MALALLVLGAGVNACRDREQPGGQALPPSLGQAVSPSLVGTPPVPAPVGGTPVAVSTSASASAPAVSVTGGAGCAAAPVVARAPAPPLPLSGRLGLWVAVVDPQTLQPIRAVAANPDSMFPLASTYKQAVLWALLREFDAGRISPTERFDVTPANQSLGDYPFDGNNVRELSQRMIQFSDNTATDILHRRTGLQKVQDVADGLGLCHTRLILPTKAWWVTQAGLSPTFNKTPGWVTATGEERTRLAQAIDADAQNLRYDVLQRKLDDYFDHRYNSADDLKVHNLSTPYEFATLLAHEFLRPGLSPRAQKWQREVMASGFGRSALRAQYARNIDYFGGKGGNGWRILTYSGYFQTKAGQRVVYVFMQHGADETYTMPNTRRAFAWINAGIDAVLGAQKPVAPTPALPTATAADRAKAEAAQGASQGH